MTVTEGAIMLAAAATGGLMNAMAGGGTIVTFPILVFLGEPAIIANATSTVALLPGAAASMAGYGREVASHREWLKTLLLPSVVGGGIGSLLLLRTPEKTFANLAPLLVLFATLLFIWQGILARRRDRRLAAGPGDGAAAGDAPPSLSLSRGRWLTAILFQFAISIYGGYFGAAIGILMLAVLGFLGLTNIFAMNGLKNFFGFCINGVAAAYFILRGAVVWPVALLMMAGAVALVLPSLAVIPRESPTEDRTEHAVVRDRHDLNVTVVARGWIVLGMTLLNTYVLYFFSDILGVRDASLGTGMVAGAALLGAIASSVAAGLLSDKFDRRAVVALSGVPMVLAALGFAIAPDQRFIFVYAALFGLGYGGVFSVGWALALDAIPALGDAARDLGVWATLSNLPGVAAPALGAFIIAHGDSSPQGSAMDDDGGPPPSGWGHFVWWIGHFHPAMTVFPIGCLLAAVLAELLFMTTQRLWLEGAARFCIIIATVGAVITAPLRKRLGLDA